MPSYEQSPPAFQPNVVLCVDGDAADRMGCVLHCNLIGLIDQAVPIRIASTDARVAEISVGPVQLIPRQQLTWPVAVRRFAELVDRLSSMPPTVIHALSHESYSVARDLAEEFEAELILGATSLIDIGALAGLDLLQVDAVIVHCDSLADLVLERTGADGSRVVVIPPGVLAADESACRAEPELAPTLVCASPFDHESHVEKLLYAIDLLRQRVRGLNLFLLGDGPAEPNLRQLVRDRQLRPQVTFARPAGNLTPALRNADFFIRPSSDTAFHDDVLQAMAAGLAVITGPTSVNDHIKDGYTALVCDCNSPETVAAALERFLIEPEFARFLGKNSLEYVRAHHTVNLMANRTAELYRNLVAQRATFTIRE